MEPWIEECSQGVIQGDSQHAPRKQMIAAKHDIVLPSIFDTPVRACHPTRIPDRPAAIPSSPRTLLPGTVLPSQASSYTTIARDWAIASARDNQDDYQPSASLRNILY
jgi:hypothetical protein